MGNRKWFYFRSIFLIFAECVNLKKKHEFELTIISIVYQVISCRVVSLLMTEDDILLMKVQECIF